MNRSYVLFQCGTPDPTTLPRGVAPDVNPDMPSFEVPLHSVAVQDRNANGYLVSAPRGIGILRG